MSMLFNDVSEALPSLLDGLLKRAPSVPSRNGNTKEFSFISMHILNPLNREVLVPERKASLAAQIAETVWVLSGRNDVEWLSHYLPRAKDFSDDGQVWRAGYGPRIRRWEYSNEEGNWEVDQLAKVVQLLREDPTTRRAVISIFDPSSDFQASKDIPCNNWLHFLARDGKLNLNVSIRSNDVIWGWSGINQFEWSVLLEIVAVLTGLEVGRIVYNVSSFHLYEHHFEKAQRIVDAFEDWELELPQKSPRFRPQTTEVSYVDSLFDAFELAEKEIREGRAYQNLIRLFPEPMLRSWLHVLAWWWRGDQEALDVYRDTPLYWAAINSPKRPIQAPKDDEFVRKADALHREKSAAYGDSWKRRGEGIGILANIARKIDRLNIGSSTVDETTADTALDLLIYLLKYRLWLAEVQGAPVPFRLDMLPATKLSDDPDHVLAGLRVWSDRQMQSSEFISQLAAGLISSFEELERAYEIKDRQRWIIVDSMLSRAMPLARTLAEREAHPMSHYVNQDR